MIYLDNSATTRQFPEVTETMIKYMEEYFEGIHHPCISWESTVKRL